MRAILALAASAALLLSGCAQTPKMLWVRADGMRLAENPGLRTQFELDTTSCLGERNKAALSGVTVSGGGLAGLAAAVDRSNAADTVARGCMAEKGYLLVAEDQAPAKQAELAAIAQQQRAQQAPPVVPTSTSSKKKPPVTVAPKQTLRPPPPTAAPVLASAPIEEAEPRLSEADRMMNNRN